MILNDADCMRLNDARWFKMMLNDVRWFKMMLSGADCYWPLLSRAAKSWLIPNHRYKMLSNADQFWMRLTDADCCSAEAAVRVVEVETSSSLPQQYFVVGDSPAAATFQVKGTKNIRLPIFYGYRILNRFGKGYCGTEGTVPVRYRYCTEPVLI